MKDGADSVTKYLRDTLKRSRSLNRIGKIMENRGGSAYRGEKDVQREKYGGKDSDGFVVRNSLQKTYKRESESREDLKLFIPNRDLNVAGLLVESLCKKRITGE